MALLDKRFHLASLTIAAAYRGLSTRRQLSAVLKARKAAILYIQDFVRRRQARHRLESQQHAAALLLQRYARGHLVSKHYIRQRGDIAIMATLKPFRDMKTEIGTQLSNLVRFLWKVYKRKKEKKKKKKKGKKGKKGKNKKLDASKTMAITPTKSFGTASVSSTPAAKGA